MCLFLAPEQMNTSAGITAEVVSLTSINSCQMTEHHDQMKHQWNQRDLF